MLPTLKQLGASGGVGALIGIGLVIWIEPTTQGGMGLIIVVSILAVIALGAAVKLIFGKKKGTDDM